MLTIKSLKIVEIPQTGGNMLEMYSLPGGKVCYSAGKKFVNDRLIELLEDVILEYVQSYDTSYMVYLSSVFFQRLYNNL